MPHILLVTADTAHVAYTRTRDALTSKGHTVTGVADTALPASPPAGVHIIATVRVTRANVNAWLSAQWRAGYPILVGGVEAGATNGALVHTGEDLGMLMDARTADATLQQATHGREMRIRAATPITAGYTVDTEYFVQTADNWTVTDWFSTAQYGTELGDIWTGSGDLGVYMASYERGVDINGGANSAPGITAPARAVFCGWFYAGQSDYAANGKTLLDQAVRWLSPPVTTPRDIPGLVAWYSAQAETGYANGAAMTQWTDQSGNSRHATAAGTSAPTWQSTTGPGGGPAVRFADGRFEMPANVMSGVTAGEVMTYVKSDGAVNGQNFWNFGTSDFANHYPYVGDGLVYDDFGSTERKSAGAPGVTITDWHRASFWSAANDWAFLTNEVTRFSTTTNAVAWPTTPYIGAATVSAPFRGHHSCIVIYNRKLTTGQRADLAAWMQANPSGGTIPANRRVGQAALTALATPATPNRRSGQSSMRALVSGVPNRRSGQSSLLALMGGVPPRRVGRAGLRVLVKELVPTYLAADLRAAGALSATTSRVVRFQAALNAQSTASPSLIVTSRLATTLDGGATLTGRMDATYLYAAFGAATTLTTQAPATRSVLSAQLASGADMVARSQTTVRLSASFEANTHMKSGRVYLDARLDASSGLTAAGYIGLQASLDAATTVTANATAPPWLYATLEASGGVAASLSSRAPMRAHLGAETHVDAILGPTLAGDLPVNALPLESPGLWSQGGQNWSGSGSMDLRYLTAPPPGSTGPLRATYGVLEHTGWWIYRPSAPGTFEVYISGPAGWQGVIELYERHPERPPRDHFVLTGAAAPGEIAYAYNDAIPAWPVLIRIHPFNTNDAVPDAQITWMFRPAEYQFAADFSGEGTLAVVYVEHKSVTTPVHFSGFGALEVERGGPAVRRWRFTDRNSGEWWRMPINPNTMTSPQRPRTMAYAQGEPSGGGSALRALRRIRVFETNSPPRDWEFGGVIYTKEHYDELVRWASKEDPIQISDHLGRTFEVVIVEFAPEDRSPTPTKSWRLNYMMRTMILRRVS